jgi:hypothetical protein
MLQMQAVQAQYEAAEEAAVDFVLVGTLGTQLETLQQQSAQLPLSEEDYLTLGDRHARLVQQLTDKCQELKADRAFARLSAVAAFLYKLKALDVSELPRSCIG